MTRLDLIPIDKPVTIEPMRASRMSPTEPGDAAGRCGARAGIPQVQRCFLCQYVCHVLRDHHQHVEFIGPRFLVNTAALEMNPLDTEDQLEELKQAHGIGFCSITKCYTEFCRENITITDNVIIPLKERVVDKYCDPLGWRWK
jgi:succinate dehydrogenase / fumarate reductase iron-sulfur subunit